MLRTVGSMQTISEEYATLSTPSAQMVGSCTSSTLDGEGAVRPSEDAVSNHSEVEPSLYKIMKETLDKYVPVTMSVVIGAYFGVGIRVLLTEFANVMYQSQTELLELLGFGFFLPNALGCFVMGIATRIKPVLRIQYEVLLTGITTGFCGSCTTFASWDLAVALMYIRGRWLNATLVLCLQIASALVSLRLGFHLAEGILYYLTVQEYPFRKPPINLGKLSVDLERNVNEFHGIKMHTFGPLVSRRVRATKQSLDIARDSCSELMAELTQVEHEQHPVQHHKMLWAMVAFVLTAVFWVLAFCGFDNYPSSRLLALCLGPFGALLRWYLSLYNSKPMCQRFPLFTFLPNLAASCLSCAMEIIGSAAFHDNALAYRRFIMWGQGGVMVGFLGSLSTVSTWVNELDGLSSRRLMWAYRYGLISVLTTQCVSVFMLGMYDAFGSGHLIG